MEAQKTATVSGEYYLRGVMETASGFKLNEDSTFEFFFSYGALDRSGHGNWKLKDNRVILNSSKPNGQSFLLVNNKHEDNDLMTIKILDDNAFFLSSVYAIVKSGNKPVESLTNKTGIVTFPKQPVDSIMLLFEFAPEKTAVFTFNNNNKEDNYFEFRFDPTVLDVFFEDLSLTIDEHELSGQHPLLKQGIYHFMRN
jgi:hypothetical protein